MLKFLRWIGVASCAIFTTPAFAQSAEINAGDTAWILTATCLVLMMTIPGLALFYGGLVRKKNVLSTLMQTFAACCLLTILWVFFGYSLAFSGSGPYLGDTAKFFLAGIGKDSGLHPIIETR